MAFCALFCQPQLSAQSEQQAVASPNILFLFADDMRASALTNPAIKTPNLDRLRSSGMLFTEAHIMGADNGAVCAPSRAMLMTGRHLSRLLPAGFNIPDDHALGMHDPWNTPLYHYQPDAVYTDRRPVVQDDRHSNKVDTLPGEYVFGGIHASEVFANAAIGFIESRSPGDNPFFLYTAFTAPHDPRSMPPEYLEWYHPDSIALPPNFMPEHPFNNGQLIIRDEQLADTPRQPEEIRQHILEYYAMISHLDAQVGRILEALEKSGQLDHTIIVFAGDNGLAVGQHGLMGKQNLYQHSVNVPLLIAGPGIPRGDSTPALCYLIDLFPTLCDLAGAEVPAGLDGRSLVQAHPVLG